MADDVSASSSNTALNGGNSNSLVSVSAFDLLLIELVPLAERMAIEYEASLDRPSAVNKSNPSTSSSLQQQQQQQIQSSSSAPPPSISTTTSTPTTTTNAAGAGTGAALPATITTTSDGSGQTVTLTPLMRELISQRLDALGYRVGLGLSERFSRDRPRFVDHLDVIKFLCKDLWTVMWKKQIDNLKTNHRGVFVLTDVKFRPLSRMSMVSNAEAVARAQVHLIFPCGIIRGVLSSLGIPASVQAETTELPTATFQIKTSGAKV